MGTPEAPRVSLQQLLNAGLNGFGIQLFIESIRRFKDWRTVGPFSFSCNGVKVTLEPDPEGAGPDRYDEGRNEGSLQDVVRDAAAESDRIAAMRRVMVIGGEPSDPERSAAQMMLGHIGGHGLERPGGFFTQLLQAMMHADHGHLVRMFSSFPDLAYAVWLYRYTLDGYDRVCAAAGVQPESSPWGGQ